ncbi:hypothetical protein SAMN06296416_10296 [Pseudoxanthomonas wuyuanensis]|uniref:Uncharacterized protein n=1 Tax=Pseudoxanthomonas wuyuanensis TaxID=1073196 RepID=A0A286D2I6_9GAMM|nr:hypothetical protein SAMN06296416_10296 [Pseudoxanthomonas wuyuanensis]
MSAGGYCRPPLTTGPERRRQPRTRPHSMRRAKWLECVGGSCKEERSPTVTIVFSRPADRTPVYQETLVLGPVSHQTAICSGGTRYASYARPAGLSTGLTSAFLWPAIHGGHPCGPSLTRRHRFGSSPVSGDVGFGGSRRPSGWGVLRPPDDVVSLRRAASHPWPALRTPQPAGRRLWADGRSRLRKAFLRAPTRCPEAGGQGSAGPSAAWMPRKSLHGRIYGVSRTALVTGLHMDVPRAWEKNQKFLRETFCPGWRRSGPAAAGERVNFIAGLGVGTQTRSYSAGGLEFGRRRRDFPDTDSPPE